MSIPVTERLESFVVRYERLAAEKKDIAEQQKDILAEAKGSGLDVQALREIIKIRAADPNALSEFEAIVELYRGALGL